MQNPKSPDSQWYVVTAMDASTLDQVFPITAGSTDVSLGLLSRPRDLCVALVLRNATLHTFDRISLSFFGEQWEDIGEVRNGTMPIQFSFGVFPTFSDVRTTPFANPNTILPNLLDGDATAFNEGYRRASWLDFGPFVTRGDGRCSFRTALIENAFTGPWPIGRNLFAKCRFMASLAKLWLVAEDGSDDFLLLEHACARIRPRPQLFWAKDGSEAQRYLDWGGQICRSRHFPVARPDLVGREDAAPGWT